MFGGGARPERFLSVVLHDTTQRTCIGKRRHDVDIKENQMTGELETLAAVAHCWVSAVLSMGSHLGYCLRQRSSTYVKFKQAQICFSEANVR